MPKAAETKAKKRLRDFDLDFYIRRERLYTRLVYGYETFVPEYMVSCPMCPIIPICSLNILR